MTWLVDLDSMCRKRSNASHVQWGLDGSFSRLSLSIDPHRELEPDMTESSYNNHQIRVSSYAPEPHHWIADILVCSPTAIGVSEQALFFPADQSFETAEDAEAYALMLAQRWIDREPSRPLCSHDVLGHHSNTGKYTPM